MTATIVTDHVAQAQARLAEQFKDKPRIAGLLAALAQQAQEFDDAEWQLATQIYLSSDADIGSATVYEPATGVQLDVIGGLLKEPRAGLSDADYALLLKAKIRLNRSSGTTEELISIFRTLYPTSLITVETWPPAYATVTIEETITATEAAMCIHFVRRGRAAGVQGTLLWQECDDANCLILSDAAAYPETDANTGLGDVADSTAGGYLTGAAG